MKKFLDRYLFSKLGLQIAFSVIVILLFSFVGTQIRTLVTNHKAPDVYSQTFWGFRQITDGGSMAGTLDDLDSVAEQSGNSYGAPVVLAIALVSWLIGMVLYSFVTGAVVNAFEGRKDKIEGGKVRYRFKDHGVVIGWDFQGVASVMALLDVWELNEVLVLTEKPSEEVRAELENELDAQSMKKVFVYKGTLGTEVGVDELYPEKAKVIIVLGDRDGFDNDGGNMKIGDLLRKKIAEAFKSKPLPEGSEPIRVFIDISNTYNLQTAEMYPAEGYRIPDGMEINIVNFCKATVRELYSSFAQFVEWNQGRKTGIYETPYRALSFKRSLCATHAHLVVAGLGDMARAIVLEMAPLIASGKDKGIITVFSGDEEEIRKFSAAFPLDELNGVAVEFVPLEIDAADSRQRLTEIAQDETASVTIFITNECADEALATANRLPTSVRFENVRLMVEQRILSKWAHKTYPLQMTGFRDVAFFGFTDRFFASLGNRAKLVASLLVGDERITGQRDRYFAASAADGLLENLAVHGYRFEYDPNDSGETVPELDRDAIAAMARYEHRREVNFKLLHGVIASASEDDVFRTSNLICAWEELSDADRNQYVARISKAVDVLHEIYACGEYPYRIEPNRYRYVLGALADETVAETAEERRKLRNDAVLPKLSSTKLRKADGKEKSTASMAIVLTPGSGLSRLLYRLSFLEAIPMIVILPCERSQFLMNIKNGRERVEMERWLRNADSIVIAEGSVSDEIRKRADGLVARTEDGWRISENLRA